MRNQPPTLSEASGPSGRADPASPNSQHPPMSRLSRLSISAFVAAFVVGLASGAVSYAHRSPVIEQRTVNATANEIEIGVAIAAAAVVVAVQLWRSRNPGRRGPSPWSAPFSARAAARVGRAFRSSPGAAALRAAPMALLILVMLYSSWRMGSVLTGAFDSNAVVNAWGGPTFTGAVLAHWMDGIIGFYAAAFLVGRLAGREPASY
jgi:hypothetical protein